MGLIDVIVLLALVCALEARNCSKRAKIWDALAELENRKQSRPDEPHILYDNHKEGE